MCDWAKESRPNRNQDACMRMVVLILPCMQGLFAHDREVILSFIVKQGGFYENSYISV